MTDYGKTDRAGDEWEYKILRSSTGQFRKPDVMHAALDEEARAGWVFVEKFDNMRMRLKRPVSARANDASLDFDPYRTFTGTSDKKLALIIVVVAAGLMVAGIAVAVITTRPAPWP